MSEMPTPPADGEQGPALLADRIHPVGFVLLALVAVFLLYQLGGALLTFVALGDITITPENVQKVRLVTMLSQLLFILGPTLILARMTEHDWRRIFPMRIPSMLEIVLVIVALLAAQRVLETLVYLQQLIPVPDVLWRIFEPVKQMLQQMMETLIAAHSTPELLFVILVAVVVPSFVEEMYFRGLIQHVMAKAWNPMAGALATGVIFGLFHLNPFDAVGLVGLGMFFGYVRYRSATMLLPMALHLANNGLAILSVQLGYRNDEMLVQSMGRTPTVGLMLAQGIVFGLVLAWVLVSYHRVTAQRVVENA